MLFTTRSTILIFILFVILIDVYYEYDSIEGFKATDPFTQIANFFKKIKAFFDYLGKFFKWFGDIIKCSIETLIGLPNCIMFYMFDLFLGTIGMIITFITSFSPSLVKARKTTWNIVTKLDKMVYKYAGFRIKEYPKSILKKCYKCKNKKMPKMPKL